MIEMELEEAEHLLEAYDCCSDERRSTEIMSLLKEILNPLILARNPMALRLKSGLPNLGEERTLTEKEFDSLHLELLKESSDGKCKEAQYWYGCHLYEQREYEDALKLYKESALQGYAPAQWCFGLDTLNGVGVPKDEVIGIHNIRLSAEQRYENAVEFMIRESSNNNYGLLSEETEKWKLILSYIL